MKLKRRGDGDTDEAIKETHQVEVSINTAPAAGGDESNHAAAHKSRAASRVACVVRRRVAHIAGLQVG